MEKKKHMKRLSIVTPFKIEFNCYRFLVVQGAWKNTCYGDDTSLYSKCDQASGLWQQLEMISEHESDLWGTVDCGRK